MNCPKCKSANTRKATVYWQCLTCGKEWLGVTQQQPTVYIIMTDSNGKGMAAIAREEGNPGEILETVDFHEDGSPNWDGGGICDYRGPGGLLGIQQLANAIDNAEANAVHVGLDIRRVPKQATQVHDSNGIMSTEALVATVLSGLKDNDREAKFALDTLVERIHRRGHD